MTQVTVRSARAMRKARSTMLDLLRADHLLHVGPRHVLEQHPQVDLLLRPPAERLPGLLPDDGHHRLVVEHVVEAVQGVDRPGPASPGRRRSAPAKLASAQAISATSSSCTGWIRLRPVTRPVEGRP